SGVSTNISGARGGNMSSSTSGGRVGPGGGGAGGVLWVNQPSIPSAVSLTANGGANGVILQDANNPYGATSGLAGVSVNNLVLPIDTILFQKNIDSTRIKDSLTGCSSYSFKGLSYTRIAAINSWQWTFGDGSTTTTQNTTHTYTSTGNYLVKLIVTDANGCKDSISKMVNVTGSSGSDFSFRLNPCTPLNIQFFGSSNSGSGNNAYWSFGDGITNNMLSPNHLFNTPGNYTVRYSNPSGNCVDTITKLITVGVQYQNLIQTPDTTICFGTSKQLRADSSNAFCWSPIINLNNPLLANPVTNIQSPIIYRYTSLVADSNLLVNGNFAQGNTGFSSAYTYSNVGNNSGQYYVGTNAGNWLNNGIACNADHTTGTGNMLLVNGSTTANTQIWSQTVSVVPNT
ncbi:MAG: PKD domain-containing protein, partial [Sphingobacteriaceae bacterium]